MIGSFSMGRAGVRGRQVVALTCGVLAVALGWPAGADAQGTRRQHGAHAHGVSRLEVTVDGRDLALTLNAPAEDIVGFEHAPRDARQTDAIAKAAATLKAADTLFQPVAEAKCRLLDATVSSDFQAPKPATPATGTSGSAPDHAEFRLVAKWSCDEPARLRHVDALIFAAFPRMRRIEAQVVSASGQRAQVLSRDKARLGLSAP